MDTAALLAAAQDAVAALVEASTASTSSPPPSLSLVPASNAALLASRHPFSRERCVGCGSDQAIRVHYGASSCHGCKAFFRRSVFEGRVYRCSAKNNCDISNESRNRCRACRFRNCLEGGMNPKHVREERNKTVERIDGGPLSSSSDPEADSSKHTVPEEHQLTLFVTALERHCEQLSDEDVAGDDCTKVIESWGRDVTLQFGLSNPELVTKRTPLNWNCERVMEDRDLYIAWYRTFVLLADWSMSIPDFRLLPQNDQTILFRQNFMTFGWMHYAYKIVTHHCVGMPIGNGAYIPYTEEGQRLLQRKWATTYGVVCRKLIDTVAQPMREMDMDEAEFCLLKTLALFQNVSKLSETGASVATRTRERLLEALYIHTERRFPSLTPAQRSARCVNFTLLFPALMYIGQIEADIVVHMLAEKDAQHLSGIPMEIFRAQHSAVAS